MSRAIFGKSPIALGQVLLEVTERQPLDNLTMARRVIAALQGLGVHVGIDDLGTGHSGLSYMLKLGVDFIKIDKLFVDAIGTERYSTTIIETLVGLGRDMKMEIIAEGVETFEQVQHLRERGIRKAQGYVFAPPLPGPSFLQLLEASDPKPVDSRRHRGRFAVSSACERRGVGNQRPRAGLSILLSELSLASYPPGKSQVSVSRAGVCRDVATTRVLLRLIGPSPYNRR